MTMLRNEDSTRQHRAAGLLLGMALAVAGADVADAALTTPSCLAKKLKEWGKLRKCQAGENAKALQAKPSDLAKCQTKFDAKLATINAQAMAAGVACRYETGALTVIDYDTGLQWQQTTDAGGVTDKDNTYLWTTALGETTPSGTAFTVFLGTLNNGTSGDGVTTTGCFAGHCDWRLPAIGELAGILDRTQGDCGGGSGPCIDQTVFGPTVADGYWSATTRATGPTAAWFVYFGSGDNVDEESKFDNYHVRGVRSVL